MFLRQLAAIGINPWTFTQRTPTIICLALSISVNICLTALIIYRLFHMSRGTYPVTISCTRIVAMFAESAALYVTTALIFVGLCIERNFAQNMVLPVLEQIQVSFRIFRPKLFTLNTNLTRLFLHYSSLCGSLKADSGPGRTMAWPRTQRPLRFDRLSR